MFIELGRLTRDVVLKKVQVGNEEEKSVVNNCLAVNYDKEHSSFIDLSAWGNTAEIMAKYLKKGDEVFIEGELRSKPLKSGDKDLTMPYILVTKIRFTHGNKNLVDFI